MTPETYPKLESFIGRRIIIGSSPDLPDGIDAARALREDLTYLRDNYGLRISMRRQTVQDKPDLALEKIRLFEARTAVNVLRQEVSKYPREFIDDCGITNIRIVNHLREKDKTWGGFAYVSGEMYLSIGRDPFARWHSWVPGFRERIHHEIFHRSDHGNKYAPSLRRELSNLFSLRKSVSWEKLNSEPYLVNESNADTQVYPKYVSAYARTNEREDRAETASLLMAMPFIAELRSRNNDILKGKFDCIIKDMKRRSGGKMDETFFSNLFAGRVNETYWHQDKIQTNH